MKKIINKIPIFFIFLLTSFFTLQVYSNELKKVGATDRILGYLDAPITMIEYASMSCPHCAEFHMNTLPLINKEYIETGKVKLVFRDFPFNLPALQASMITRCVEENLYFKYIEALFKLQPSWVKENSDDYLFEIIKNGGMTREEFDSCLQNEELKNEILENQLKANKELNIKTTPSFIINGKLVEGNKSIKTFRKIFDNILNN